MVAKRLAKRKRNRLKESYRISKEREAKLREDIRKKLAVDTLPPKPSPGMTPATFYDDGGFLRRRFEEAKKPRKKKYRRYVQYWSYIRGRAWKKRRRRKIESVDGKCENCGTKDHLNVHHLTYERLGDEPMEDLQVLCETCHRAAHQVDWDAQDHLRSIMHECY